MRSRAAAAVAVVLLAAATAAPADATTTTEFSNATTITVPATNPNKPGIASPYPSPIEVLGVTDPVTDVQVTLTGLDHTFPQDLGLVLVAPNDDALLVMDFVSDEPLSGSVDLTIADGAAAFMPETGPLSGGTFKPTAYSADEFPDPGPSTYQVPGPTLGSATFGSTFGGDDANGTWNLYVVDAAFEDSGSIAGGWSLTITSAPTTATPTVLSTTPAPPSAAVNPKVHGTAEPGSTVTLYRTSTCTGAMLGSGSAEEFAGAGITATVARGSTTSIHAKATKTGQTDSACSTTSASYTQQDPDTTLTRTPRKRVWTTKRRARVAFAFASTTVGATFECRMDNRAFAPCASGKKFRLRPGRHTFEVRAVSFGVADQTPATYRFRVKRRLQA